VRLLSNKSPTSELASLTPRDCFSCLACRQHAVSNDRLFGVKNEAVGQDLRAHTRGFCLRERRTAGPSTSLRFGRDDKSKRGEAP